MSSARMQDAAVAGSSSPSSTTTGSRSPLRVVWSALVGAVGVVVGLAPHVLHHVGFLVGTALVAGATGTVVFGLLGLVASVPMLWRLYRRFGSWWAPGIALVIFAAMFSLSTFVIGPRISDAVGSGAPSTPSVTQPSVSPSGDHAAHHQP